MTYPANRHAIFAIATLAIAAWYSSPLTAEEAANDQTPPAGVTAVTPTLNAERGRDLFVSKGCVVCHAINGVGGKAAPALDATDESRQADIADFAARMWRSAFAMAELQAVEFAYQIELEGDEMADLAAFAADHVTQETFTEDHIPDDMKDWILEEPFYVDDPVFGKTQP